MKNAAPGKGRIRSAVAEFGVDVQAGEVADRAPAVLRPDATPISQVCRFSTVRSRFLVGHVGAHCREDRQLPSRLPMRL